MEEPNTPSQVPLAEDIGVDIKDCDYICGSSKESSRVSMPICFLVREQAKSQVAIQDLQNRLSQVENVQVDVIDTLMQFQNYLCEASNSNVSPSYLKNLDINSSVSKTNASTYHSTFEPSRSSLKNRSYSTKVNENSCSHEFQRPSCIVTIQDQPQKHFDLIKSKDSALESDKQDSGLDSDCRELNDCHPSIRNAPVSIYHDGNDQLLQLLDEISYRSEYLQKQLTVVEENTILSDIKEGMTSSHSNAQNNSSSPPKNNSCLETNFETLQASGNTSGCVKSMKNSNSADTSHEIGVQVAMPSSIKFNNSGFAGFFEGKSFSDKGSSNKLRAGKSIDSTLVSSILKETNVVELQRQALIYVVDNAVLNTKLRETEQALTCKNVESDKVENSLKEEARLLMMENRELRICLDEQKMEANILKSRVSMLEKVLQSITAENQELNWQLGESLNLQQFSKNGLNNLSSSFTFSNSANSAKSVKKSSSSQALQNSNLSGSKSKFMSNASGFLDVTVEEPDEFASNQIKVTRTKYRTNGPIHSSTPFQRPKGIVIDSHGADLPASFTTLKKCLKTGHSFDSESASFKSAKSERYTGESSNIPDSSTKRRNSSHMTLQEPLTLPLGNVSKFPFNTILEKLKTNSEIRLSRSVPSTKDGEISVSASDQEVDTYFNDSPAQGQQRSPMTESKSQGNAKINIQTRKSRDIHQRIQNILDRIVAESEEAS